MVKHIALVVLLFFAINTSALSQTGKTSTLNAATLKAFEYFEQIRNQQLDDFLRSIRPRALTRELRERVLNMLPKADLVNPSAEYEAKIKSLDRILKYHQRDSIIEIKVLRANTATAVFLAGAAILITEPALKILRAEELQAVVAHELAHEYYWNRFELARKNRDYAQMQELELRCDGIAVVALYSVGIDPKNLVSAITKLNRYNEHHPGSPSSPNYVGFNERVAFIRQMIELVSSKQTSPAQHAE
jgi:Peptidase family M48